MLFNVQLCEDLFLFKENKSILVYKSDKNYILPYVYTVQALGG